MQLVDILRNRRGPAMKPQLITLLYFISGLPNTTQFYKQKEDAIGR